MQRQATLAQIKGNFPEMFPPTPESAAVFAAQKKKIQEDALNAVYGWVVAPDEGNSQKALSAGNAAASMPEGLLAYTAFWSFGNLVPEAKTVIQTPPGLAATGLKSVLLMLALTPGGIRSKEERYEHYFSLGIEVARGANLWAKSLEDISYPHDAFSMETEPETSIIGKQERNENNAVPYKKWNPTQR